MQTHSTLDIHPVTPDRWDDLAALFGRQGAVGGCWCMWWRLRASDFGRQSRAARRQAFHERVQRGDPPGLVAYAGGLPAGWCSVAPREEFLRLRYSPTIYRPLDDDPGVWSILCFFVRQTHRGAGVAAALLAAAVAYARERGARAIEAYPIDTAAEGRVSDWRLWQGTLGMFREAGFQEVIRRRGQPLVRLTLE